MNKSISFEEHINSNKSNYKALVENFPKTIIAAEYINDLFDQIFGERFQHDNQILWQYCAAKMIFGIHYCWINYFLQTSMGYNDIGLMIGRRAIEYTCYISKIKNRDTIAKLWFEKTTNPSKSKEFSRNFSVPQSYFKAKYSHLIPLLVIYNFSSEYGVHGNHATLISKLRNTKYRNKISMSYQDDSKGIPHSCGVAIQTGSFIIEALMKVLSEQIRDYDEFFEKIKIKKQIISDALLEVIEFTDQKPADYEIIEAINNEDMTEIHNLYEELKKNYKAT